jgi:phosphoglycolate phosphatase-like HAD superfamily hydrolase
LGMPPLLILDFDGVVCDSIEECFVSSWIAYFNLYRGEHPAKVPVTLRADFGRLRPFIRTGEDYLVIQEALFDGVDLSRQDDFDGFAESEGAEKLRTFKELFTRARNELLEKDRKFWLSLNRVYPHVLSIFGRLPQEAPVHILSTKMPQFIKEILSYSRIHIPEDHIHESATKDKLVRVERLLAEGDFDRVIFIDDQIDHLRGNTNPKISVYLASWGYVKPEWLSGAHGVPLIDEEGFIRLVDEEYAPR